MTKQFGTPEMAGNFGSENLIGDALDGVKDLAIADFDGDDDLDVVAACSVADDIIYMENMGNGTFGPKESLLSGIYWFDGAASVRPFDFDSDGDMDVVSASALSHVMGWHENDGLGNFSDFQYLTQEIFEPQCVDVGDVDKDGDYDLASAVLFADLIAFHYNPGNDDPWTDVDLNIDMTNAIFVRMGDLDRDGDLDVVGCGRFSDTFSWFENDGLGNFGPEILLTNANDNPEALAIGDLDGDLDKDIAIVSFQDDKVSWIKNNTPAPCLASDFDFSGNVDTADLLGFLTAFGCNYVCGWYDLDGNEEVNTQDILILLAQFGQGC